MNAEISKAIEAAAKEIRGENYCSQSFIESPQVVEIITRHIAPVLAGMEADLRECRDAILRERRTFDVRDGHYRCTFCHSLDNGKHTENCIIPKLTPTETNHDN